MKIDVHSFVGHWPFRRIPYRTVADTRQLLARTATDVALITPMASIFYKDCLSAAQELHEALGTAGGTDLLLVAVVNPAFPGWLDDLSIILDDLGCVAVRLIPNYHQYRLTDPEAGALLTELQRREVPLFLSPRVEDERLHHWLVTTPPVSRLDIRWLLRAYPGLKIVLCNLNPDEVGFLQREIVTHPAAYVDTSARMPQFYLEEMVGQLGVDRVVYGTGIPLHYPEPTLRMIGDAHLSEADRRKILYENASRLFDIEKVVRA